MSAFDTLIRKIKRGETPVYRFIGSLARALIRPQAPVLPRTLKPVFRALYEFHYLVIQTARLLITLLLSSSAISRKVRLDWK